jgi:hypothetical protein
MNLAVRREERIDDAAGPDDPEERPGLAFIVSPWRKPCSRPTAARSAKVASFAD